MLKLNETNTVMKMQRTWKQLIPSQTVYIYSLNITSLVHILGPPTNCTYSLF